MRVDVWVSIGVNVEVNDPNDHIEVAGKAQPEILNRILREGLTECIEEVTPYDPETGK